MNTIHRRRASIHSKAASRIVQEQESDLANVAAAIDASAPLDFHQILSFERIIKVEIEGLDEELRGKCFSDNRISYPHNITLRDFAGYIPLPTLVYELEYPRQDHINWFYVAEKTAATFGVLGVMIVVSQAYIYPVVVYCVAMKEKGMPLSQRLQEFPGVLSDLLFPFMMEYLLAWYVIWECIVSGSSPPPPTSSGLPHLCKISFRFAMLCNCSFTQYTLKSIPIFHLAQCPCGIDNVRRPRLLRRLVEFHVLGPIRSRLESTGSQLPPSTCLPFLNLRFSNFTLFGHRHHFLAKRLCT